MKLNKKSLILLFSSLFFVFPLLAKEKSKSPNAECLSCHSAKLVSKAKSRINEKYFFSSVHASLNCIDCHQAILRDTDEDIPHQKDLPDVNCIAGCHQEEKQISPGGTPVDYPDSVHGKAFHEKEIQEAAKCWDCHGKHNIRSPSDFSSRVNRKNISLICTVCHGNFITVFTYQTHLKKPSQDYMESVHGKALYKAGLLRFAAACTDCHGVHNIKKVSEPDFFAKRPENCGKCHILVFNKYKESTHGQEALSGNIDAPFCVDCHGEHKILSPLDEEAPTSRKNVSHTCCICHARPNIMKKFEIYEDGIESFIQSAHGIKASDSCKAAVNCASCHGFHDIRPSDDFLSRINPANLSKTCGQENCHPGMPEKIANSKIHISTHQEKSGYPYDVQPTFLWILLIIAIIIILWYVTHVREIEVFRN